MRGAPFYTQEVAAAVSQRQYTPEVTNNDIETFRATSWRNQRAMPASNAFSAAKEDHKPD
jgi:hypothetical protein